MSQELVLEIFTEGGSIIIPIAISVEETTMSITRKGMKSIKPIWNALVSSLSMNAGMTVKRMASAIHGHPTLSEVVMAAARQF